MFFIRFANYQKKKKIIIKWSQSIQKQMKDHLPHFSFTHTTPSHELIIPFQNILLLLQQIDN